MTEKKLEIGQIVADSWQLALKNIWFFVLVLLIYGALTSGLSYSQSNINDDLAASGLGVASIIMSLILAAGLIKISLLVVNQKQAGLEELFINYKKAWRIFLSRLLIGLISFAGLLLLIVPGIIWSIKYQFTEFLIVDRDLKVLEAMRESARLTNGYKWQLFTFNILLVLINLAGMIALFVGLFLTVPTTWLAQAKAYRVLSE